MTFRVTIRDMFPHHLPFRKTIRCLDVLDVDMYVGAWGLNPS